MSSHYRHYFDVNATTPLNEASLQALNEAHVSAWMNPASPYSGAAQARRHMEEARGELATYLGVHPDRIVFVSGATEANNMVLKIFTQAGGQGGSPIAISAIEHPSVYEPAQEWFGDSCRKIPVSSDGVVSLETLDAWLQHEAPALVSVLAANNETGVLQPWRSIAARCSAAGVAYHCDASQWLGKESPEGLGECDFISGCAHKFGGPRGVGFLVVSERWAQVRGFRGGGQEHDRRSGTENVAGIVAMVAALQASTLEAEQLEQRRQWRDAFIAAIKREIPGTIVVGEEAPRLWNTVSLIMPQFANTRWTLYMDRLGFQLSTGSACASVKSASSPVLAAMGYSNEEGKRALRISSGWWTREQDWQDLIQGFRATWEKLQADQDDRTSMVIEV